MTTEFKVGDRVRGKRGSLVGEVQGVTPHGYEVRWDTGGFERGPTDDDLEHAGHVATVRVSPEQAQRLAEQGMVFDPTVPSVATCPEPSEPTPPTVPTHQQAALEAQHAHRVAATATAYTEHAAMLASAYEHAYRIAGEAPDRGGEALELAIAELCTLLESGPDTSPETLAVFSPHTDVVHRDGWRGTVVHERDGEVYVHGPDGARWVPREDVVRV